MVRKRRPGGGRKPQGAVAKSVSYTTRTTPDLRRALELEARKSGRSLSNEIDHRLRLSLEKPPPGARHHHALGVAAELLAQQIEADTGLDWRTDDFTSMALHFGIQALLAHFAAAAVSAPVTPPRVEAAAAKMPSEFAERFRQPSGFGHVLAFHLIHEIEQARAQAAPGWKPDELSLPVFFSPLGAEKLALVGRDLQGEKS
jgi:hypothetical protein